MNTLATFIKRILMIVIVALPILACSYSDDLMMMPHDTVSSSEPAITPALNDDKPATITIVGTVSNWSGDGIVPPNLSVKLYSDYTVIAETLLRPDQTFQFDNVSIAPLQNFYTSVEYGGIPFTSPIMTQPTSPDATLDLSIRIFETTYHHPFMRVTGIEMFISLDGEMLNISETVSFANTVDMVYAEVEDGLISGVIIGFSEEIWLDDAEQRFRLSEDARMITDTRPLYPQSDGEPKHEVSFTYSLPYPYEGEATIEQIFPYWVGGELDIFIEQDGLFIDGDWFEFRGERTIGEQTFTNFGTSLSLDPEEPLRFIVTNTPDDGKQVAPDFTFTTFDGETHTLADFRGKVVVLNFWAIWSQPSHDEAPELQAAWEYYQSQNADVVFIGVAYDDEEPSSRQFLEDYGITYLTTLDVELPIVNAYKVEGIPETFIIDKDGVVVERIIGAMTTTRLIDLVDTALEGDAP